VIQAVGWVFLPAGIIVFALWFKKYQQIKNLIQGAEKVCQLDPKPE
jgi:hypothetical protein